MRFRLTSIIVLVAAAALTAAQAPPQDPKVRTAARGDRPRGNPSTASFLPWVIRRARRIVAARDLELLGELDHDETEAVLTCAAMWAPYRA